MNSLKNFTLPAAAIMLTVLVGCANSCIPALNPSAIADQGSCKAACANLARLNCDEGKPILMGATCQSATNCKDINGNVDSNQVCQNGQCSVTCEVFCTETENNGVWLKPACVQSITSCGQLNDCSAK